MFRLSKQEVFACEEQWFSSKPGGFNQSQADEEIRTLDPLLGKEMLYH
jgi:hypothetical protein